MLVARSRRRGERTRIDWWRVLTDLERARVSQADVAQDVGRSLGWVAYLKNSPGAAPRYDEGVWLLQLWARHTGLPFHDAPARRD